MTADTEGEMATDATVLSDGSVGELRQALSGTLITPADPDYEGARRVWNGVIDRRPALIARWPAPPTSSRRCASRAASAC